MQNKEGEGLSGANEVESSGKASAAVDYCDWPSFTDDEDIMEQRNKINAMEGEKIPFISEKGIKYPESLDASNIQKAGAWFEACKCLDVKIISVHLHCPEVQEALSSLAAEYQSGSPILLQKIKILEEQYAAIRRTRGDGNCFFRAFMFSYLEHILETQDGAEVDRIKSNIEECRRTLQSLGYVDFTFEDFFSLFLEQLDSVLQGDGTSISPEELLHRSQDPSVSDYVVMFFRFVTSAEIRKRTDFFEPFIMGLANTTVEQFCKSSVEPMGEESDHVHIIALSDALGVPVRAVYLDRSSCDDGNISINNHDFIPTALSSSSEHPCPFITLLYRPGHYDILYTK